jgi:hypothetical protein
MMWFIWLPIFIIQDPDTLFVITDVWWETFSCDMFINMNKYIYNSSQFF